MEVRDITQETGIKIIPKKNKCKNAKWLSEVALQIAMKRRQVKSKGEKERYTHLNAEIRKPFQHCTAPLIHKVKSLSSVQLLVTLWTVAHQAPPSMEFSRQEYWSGLPNRHTLFLTLSLVLSHHGTFAQE